jgi:arylsulfatase A-like enzyme
MKSPNILLITIDSLRRANLSCYGYDIETTPNLSRIARDGLIFDNAISPGNWTGASIASILTGLYPTSHGFTNSRYYLDGDVPSIVTILKSVGYDTCCFSNNIYIAPETGLTQGFDSYYYKGREGGRHTAGVGDKGGFLDGLKDSVSIRTKTILKDLIDSFNRQRALQRDDGAHQTEVAFMKRLVTRQRTSPFFAFIHYQEPHSVYFPPLPFRRRFFDGSWWESLEYLDFDHVTYFSGKMNFIQSRIDRYQQMYDGEIAYLDWRLGRIFDALREAKMLDETVVIITADHGECFGENGYLWHAFCLYDPLIRVPLIVRYPQWFSQGQHFKELAQTNDLLPTVLDGLGIKWDYRYENQGISFLNGPARQAALTETFNPEQMVDRWLNRCKHLAKEDFAQYFRDLKSYRTLTEKLIRSSDGINEYYDLVRDPAEKQNIYDSDKEDVRQCEKALASWHGSLKPHVADGKQPGFDKATWEKMKALGYA